MRAAALVLSLTVSTLGGCKFAVQHPAITAGLVGGGIGLGSCELAGASQKSCLLIGGGAGALLGLVAWVAILAGGEGNTVLNEPMTEEPEPRPKPPAPVPAPDELHARIVAQQRVVEAFFGERLRRPFDVRIVPTHAAMASFALEQWQTPQLPCFAVAMGTGSTLLVLDPAAWSAEACDHAADDRAAVDKVLAHELVHVFHGQHRPADPELAHAEAVAWFVEGLAIYAANQLGREREQQVKELVAAGHAPTQLVEAWGGPARYAVAGTLVRLIDRRIGRARVRELLTASTNAEILDKIGMTERELLDAWRASVSVLDPAPP